MDVGQRQPGQERGDTTSTEGTQGQTSLHYGELPRSNGTIESAYKQVILAFRAVLSELKTYADEWPEVVNMSQSVLNNSLSNRLKKGR
jgi:hypothetical protein